MITFGIRQKSNDTWERRKKTFAPASMTELNYSHRLPRKKENKNWINSNMISNERINRLSGWQSALKGNILFFKAFRLAKLNGNKLKSTTNVLRTSTNETLFVEKETHPPFFMLFPSPFLFQFYVHGMRNLLLAFAHRHFSPLKRRRKTRNEKPGIRIQIVVKQETRRVKHFPSAEIHFNTSLSSAFAERVARHRIYVKIPRHTRSKFA